MTGNAIWLWVAVLVIVIGIYWLYKSGKLGKIKLPKVGPKPTLNQLEEQTGKERAKAVELRSVLDAKRSLARARAENIRLTREIDGVNEKSVEKEKQDEQKAQEAQKVKPRRL